MLKRWLLLGLLGYAVSGYSQETVEPVSFLSGGEMLAGEIHYPAKANASAAIVLVHGAGKVVRMSNLAMLLAYDGFVVLTYDKRGTGRSGGTYEIRDVSATNLDLLARDAAAAMNALQAQPRVKGMRIGYVGLSQAGWVVPFAALKAPSPDFIAFWSGPVCTVSEEIYFSDWAEGDSAFWKKHSREDVVEYMKSATHFIGDVDPRSTLSQLSIPGLWLFGAADNSIPVDLSVANLNDLIANGHAYEKTVFPGEGHNLADSPKQESYQYMVRWLRNLWVNKQQAQ